jgi:hypothetical protein
LSGLITERTLCTTPSAMSKENTQITCSSEVSQYRSCLAIHLMESDDDAELTDLPAQPTEQSGDALRSNYRLHPLWGFATPVAVDDDVGGEQVNETVKVTIGHGSEEASR